MDPSTMPLNTIDEVNLAVSFIIKNHIVKEVDLMAFSTRPVILNKNGYGCETPAKIWRQEGSMSVRIIEENSEVSPFKKMFAQIDKEVRQASHFVEGI